MMKYCLSFALFFIFGAMEVNANSYIEMITQKPEGGVEKEEKVEIERREVKPNTWYDNRLAVKSPIVQSKYPSYVAWAKAKEQEGKHYNLKDELQKAIYTFEGIALGYGVYELLK